MRVGEWSHTMDEERAYWEQWLRSTIRYGHHMATTGGYWNKTAGFVKKSLDYLGVEITDDTNILEIGPGIVGAIQCFPKGNLYVCDPLWYLFEEMRPRLKYAQEFVRHDVTLLALAAEDMPGAALFDLVLMINSLDHCRDPGVVLDRLHAVIRRGGLLYEATTVWGRRDLIRGTVDPYGYGKGHPHLYWNGELDGKIKKRRFEKIQDPFYGLPLREAWASHVGFTKESWPCYLRVWKNT